MLVCRFMSLPRGAGMMSRHCRAVTPSTKKADVSASAVIGALEGGAGMKHDKANRTVFARGCCYTNLDRDLANALERILSNGWGMPSARPVLTRTTGRGRSVARRRLISSHSCGKCAKTTISRCRHVGMASQAQKQLRRCCARSTRSHRQTYRGVICASQGSFTRMNLLILAQRTDRCQHVLPRLRPSYRNRSHGWGNVPAGRPDFKSGEGLFDGLRVQSPFPSASLRANPSKSLQMPSIRASAYTRAYTIWADISQTVQLPGLPQADLCRQPTPRRPAQPLVSREMAMRKAQIGWNLMMDGAQ